MQRSPWAYLCRAWHHGRRAWAKFTDWATGSSPLGYHALPNQRHRQEYRDRVRGAITAADRSVDAVLSEVDAMAAEMARRLNVPMSTTPAGSYQVTVTQIEAGGQQNAATLRNVQAAEEILRRLQPNTQAGSSAHVNSPHRSLGIRLPRVHKVAYGQAELFRQQANAQTFDMGLQVVLNNVLYAARRLLSLPELVLTEMKFTINFGSPVDETSRRYVVSVTAPGPTRFTIEQTVSARTMMPCWRVTGEGFDAFDMGMDTLGPVEYDEPQVMPDQPVRTRRIELH